MLHAQEHSTQVYRMAPVPFLKRNFVQRLSERPHSCRATSAVKPPEAAHCVVHHRCDLRFVRHIDRESHGIAAHSRRFGSDLGGRRSVYVGDRHARACLDQSKRNGAPDAMAPPVTLKDVHVKPVI